MTDPKTRPTRKSVVRFLQALPDERQRRDATALTQLMEGITRAKPEMWGSSIVGFGRYSLTYADGREAEWPLAAFSPRKRELTIYLEQGFTRERSLLRQLGRHKTSKVCLYIKSLEDVELQALKALIRKSIKVTKGRASWGQEAS
jgi:hypothetical protein